MAQLDVTDILTDPDFTDSLTLIHRTPAVDSGGLLNLTERQVQTIGSVQPASGKTLNRLPEALRVQSIYSFFLKGEIVSDGQCKYPDVILFKGQRYSVQIVMDWMNYGPGFCEGTCIRERPAA